MARNWHNDIMSAQVNVFGISGLANPSYMIADAATVEKSYIAGGAAAAGGAATDESRDGGDGDARALLKSRLDEIEKRLGARVFDDATADATLARQEPSADDARGAGADADADADFAPSARGAPSAPGDTGGDFAPSAPSAPRAVAPALRRAEIISTEGLHHTDEEARRNRLTSAMNALSINADDLLETDRENSYRLEMLEEIDDLLALFRDDGEQIDHIRRPTADDTTDIIKCTLGILRRHNDRRRYGSLADDCLMLAATSIGSIFDGRREIFGFRPNMTGWPNAARARLRRMRHETSQIASSIFNNYNIGPGARLLLEFVPSMIMYARDHTGIPETTAAKAPTDADFANALANIRDTAK